ncbi:B12-binding domain-containing radical SAM protein [Alcanivorax jadensis]|uniref:B12-binding domain-containing radical SAM protein n=1 Tax=Alcanivorax jadensis TaxID=64988 RepID=UPI00240A848D|nr:radical SAM protein [Alcanivorax jadensis]MDF1637856.1 radical SAM protein [Alcanivorax jadensis]
MNRPKIRVENLSGVNVSSFSTLKPTAAGSVRPFRILFVKPYQQTIDDTYGPPLGLLTLISCVRQHFGSVATIHFWDMKLYNEAPHTFSTRLEEYRPDIIAVSALNCEASASYTISQLAKEWSPETITAIGGPFTLRQSNLIFNESSFDWIFEGAADRTFVQALERQFSNEPLGEDIAGFNHRDKKGVRTYNGQQDLITDLDSIPIPAWDMADLERYRKRDRKRIITNINERKYAYLFTSRGCPYLCNYCHDVFTKRFVYQSKERVLEEIRILHEEHGVTEIHIIDDIFNLHKPRAQAIMRAAAERWPGKLYFAFPNGLRGDILDQETIDCLVAGGTYVAVISIETVTERLQTLVEKNLIIEKAQWAIEEFARQGVIARGAFMLGFPSETPEEIEQTIRYAIRSSLSTAAFAAVVPQNNTPIYDLAMNESPSATLTLAREELDGGDYNSLEPWYSRAYGFDLHRKITIAYVRFYLHPPRMFRLLRHYGVIPVVQGSFFVISRVWQALRGLLTKGKTPSSGKAEFNSGLNRPTSTGHNKLDQ